MNVHFHNSATLQQVHFFLNWINSDPVLTATLAHGSDPPLVVVYGVPAKDALVLKRQILDTAGVQRVEPRLIGSGAW